MSNINVRNFIIYGSGNIAEVYCRLLKENFLTNLVALVGNSEDKTKKLAEKYNCKPYFKGNLKQAIIDNVNVDAVIIASSEWSRLNPIEIAVNYKKHILYEKPMASSLNEAKKIYKIFQSVDNKILILPVFNLRFSPQYNSAKQRIINNEIGEIRHIISKRNGNKKIAKRIMSKMSPFY